MNLRGSTKYEMSNNLVKDEDGDLLADSHNVLNRWKNYFSRLLNVHNVSHGRSGVVWPGLAWLRTGTNGVLL
jgi:hypothetical protein